jgi:hypothetical protein
MINNPSPEGSGTDWNSDKIALDNLSCRQLAALSTAFLGAFRLISPEGKKMGPEGVLRAVHNLLQHHIDILDSGIMPDEFKKSSQEASSITLLAFCMGGIAALGKVDPRHLGTLAVTLMESAVDLAKKTGPIGPDEVILVDARIRSPEDDGQPEEMGLNKIELGMRLESADMLDEIASKSPVAKAIKKVLNEEQNPEGNSTHGRN